MIEIGCPHKDGFPIIKVVQNLKSSNPLGKIALFCGKELAYRKMAFGAVLGSIQKTPEVL